MMSLVGTNFELSFPAECLAWDLGLNCFSSLEFSGYFGKAKLFQFLTIQLPVVVSGVPGALVAQWVKRWPTDPADRVRCTLEVKSPQP